MILNVEKPYIWLPVSKNAPERKLHFYIEGKKIQEIDIHLGKTDCVKVGVAYELQVANHLPTEENDLPMEYLVTEKGVWKRQ